MQSWERKMELEESGSLTSNYTAKLQEPKQCGIGTETGTCTKEQDREPRNNPTHMWSVNLRQSCRGHTAGKVSSINDAEKTWCCLHRTQNYLKPTLFHIKPFLCWVLWKWNPLSSQPQTGSFSPLFCHLLPPWWHFPDTGFLLRGWGPVSSRRWRSSMSWRDWTSVCADSAGHCPEAKAPARPERTRLLSAAAGAKSEHGIKSPHWARRSLQSERGGLGSASWCVQASSPTVHWRPCSQLAGLMKPLNLNTETEMEAKIPWQATNGKKNICKLLIW